MRSSRRIISLAATCGWILGGSLLVASLLGASACVDVRGFEGGWTGAIVAEPAVRQGFVEDTRVVRLELSNVRLQGLNARLTTSDGRFENAELSRITKAAGDALASLSFDGDPLRSYLLFAEPTTPSSRGTAEGSAVIVVSLFGDEHVELRVIRGNDLFGVFYLRRLGQKDQ